MTITSLSFVTPTSSSSMSAPTRSACSNAYIVLDGYSSSPPWWAMFSGRRSSQGFVAAEAGAALSAMAEPSRTARRGRRRIIRHEA
ncbi:hypothetical protein LRS13_25095 [Svornostia abyssi]|uniref:Uncharacterized protein n=1 Tax=Svornostia abyssi TaxID=2898438 RepID=A0ABY5PQF5_9ACTN|nr:hypothetical protein LRS13_25095 [Parviterribacteraceae bacterium J379]